MFRSTQKKTAYQGWGLYILWTMLFISFMSSTSAMVYFGDRMAAGFPVWLLIGRIAVLLGIFFGSIGMLSRKRWGFYTFFAVMAAMIPLSITYTYFVETLDGGFDLTLSWILQTTIITSVVVMGIVWLVFYVLQRQINLDG